MHGKVKIEKDRCKGCEYCIIYCPQKCFELSHQINVRGAHYAVFVDPVECTGCGICARVCPDVCIRVIQKRGKPIYRRMEKTISRLVDSGLDKLRNPTQEDKSKRTKSTD